jgi:hypothetical protein
MSPSAKDDGTRAKNPQVRMVTDPYRAKGPGPVAWGSSRARACVARPGQRRANAFHRRQLGGDRLRRALRSAHRGFVGKERDRTHRRIRLRYVGGSAGPVLRPAQSARSRRGYGDGDDRNHALSPCRPRPMGLEQRRRAAERDDGSRPLWRSHAHTLARLTRTPDNRPLHACRSGNRNRFRGSRLCW